MRKRTFIAVALAVVFVLALAAPVFAQSMTHNATYTLEGNVNLQRQVGHLCNTGAEMKQSIAGIGKVTKTTSAAMIPGRLTVTDTNDIVTAPGAARNLAVISVIELCAPPKYVYEDTDAVVSPAEMYSWLMPATVGPYGTIVGENMADRADAANWEAVNTSGRQIWAASIEAAPGTTGTLNQKFDAAYGPFGPTRIHTHNAGDGIDNPLNADADPAIDIQPWDLSRWMWNRNADGVIGPRVGRNFVGNYFNMEQFARVTQGTTRRFIDISSPWSHAYFMEDINVVGAAEIREGFVMGNLPRGEAVVGLWWDLF